MSPTLGARKRKVVFWHIVFLTLLTTFVVTYFLNYYLEIYQSIPFYSAYILIVSYLLHKVGRLHAEGVKKDKELLSSAYLQTINRVEKYRTAINTLSFRLASALTEQQLGRILAEESRKVFNHDAFNIDYIDTKNTEASVSCFYAEDRRIGSKRYTHFEEEFHKPIEAILESKVYQQKRGILYHPNGDKDVLLKLKFGFKDQRPKCVIAAPIYWDTTIVGMIAIHSYTAQRYTEDDVFILESFANQCSAALMRTHESENSKTLLERLTSLQVYARALDAVALPIVFWNARRVIYVNDKARDLFGGGVYDSTEKTFDQLVIEDKSRCKKLQARFKKAEYGEQISTELKLKGADGETIEVSMDVSKIFSESVGGDPRDLFCGIIRETNIQKQLAKHSHALKDITESIAGFSTLNPTQLAQS